MANAPNRKIIVLDDEPGVLDAYRIILSPPPAPAPILSSRALRGTNGRQGLALAPSAPAAPVGQPTEADPALRAFEVNLVSSGDEALRLIEAGVRKQEPFAGGFFDVKLGPGMDGIETIQRAKDIDPNLLCVIVTAYQDRNIDEITRIFGEDFADRWDFITKPFNRSEILQKARNLISNWERRRREKEYLEQIRSQQAMLIAQERLAAVGTLARGIGHEFGNILLRIIGRAEIARQDKNPEEMIEALEVIADAAERAGVIVRNLQSLVRMEPLRDLGDVRNPLADSLQLMDHELKRGKIRVIEAYAPSLPPINFNRVEIGQVFLNLIINASHAMETNGGELKVRTFAQADWVGVEIRDSGCGIAPEHLSRIFEPLFTTKGERGSGIGLSVAQRIIESHGGRIDVQSEVGKGTSFVIWLPIKS